YVHLVQVNGKRSTKKSTRPRLVQDQILRLWREVTPDVIGISRQVSKGALGRDNAIGVDPACQIYNWKASGTACGEELLRWFDGVPCILAKRPSVFLAQFA